jgi:hypothetical protein
MSWDGTYSYGDWEVPIDLDLECKNLCIALNALPGIETEESCCGHGEGMYYIWFRVTDYTQRGFLFLSRLMCRNYYPFYEEWQVTLEHSDTEGYTRRGGWRQILYLLQGPPGYYTWDGQPRGGYADAEKMTEIIKRHILKEEEGYNFLYHTVDNKTYDDYWQKGKKIHDFWIQRLLGLLSLWNARRHGSNA